MSENLVLEKSYQFALRIVRLYKFLTEEKREYILSKQLLSAGTYIGAYVKSAQEAESKAAFTHEMQLALQYVSRTDYWLRLLHEGGFLEQKHFDAIDPDREDLRRLIIAIVKTAKGIKQDG